MKQVIGFRSYDGKLFGNRDECLAYEEFKLKGDLGLHIRTNCNTSFRDGSPYIDRNDISCYKISDIVNYLMSHREGIIRLLSGKELEVVYTFKSAPEWVRWSAIDSDGHMYWYNKKPVINDSEGVWEGVGEFDRVDNLSGRVQPCSHWKDTLIEREL